MEQTINALHVENLDILLVIVKKKLLFGAVLTARKNLKVNARLLNMKLDVINRMANVIVLLHTFRHIEKADVF
jgi:hypothetical protein